MEGNKQEYNTSHYISVSRGAARRDMKGQRYEYINIQDEYRLYRQDKAWEWVRDQAEEGQTGL